MGQKEVRVKARAGILGGKLGDKVSEAGAAVEDEQLGVDPDLNAGSVAAIAKDRRMGPGARAAHTPESHAQG
jgi:hypothetical protein